MHRSARSWESLSFLEGTLQFSKRSPLFKEISPHLRFGLFNSQSRFILRKSKRMGVSVLSCAEYLCTHPRIFPSAILHYVHVWETSLFSLVSKRGCGACLQALVREDEPGGDHVDGRVGDGRVQSSTAFGASPHRLALRRPMLPEYLARHALEHAQFRRDVAEARSCSDAAAWQISSAGPAASQSRAGSFADGICCASESVAAPRSCPPPVGWSHRASRGSQSPRKSIRDLTRAGASRRG